MAASQNFRSAFNGFNREDVVHYLEYLNTKHTNQVNQHPAAVHDRRGGAGGAGRLCADHDAPPPRPAGAEKQQPQPEGVRQARGAEYAGAGHRRRHHEAIGNRATHTAAITHSGAIHFIIFILLLLFA